MRCPHQYAGARCALGQSYLSTPATLDPEEYHAHPASCVRQPEPLLTSVQSMLSPGRIVMRGFHGERSAESAHNRESYRVTLEGSSPSAALRIACKGPVVSSNIVISPFIINTTLKAMESALRTRAFRMVLAALPLDDAVILICLLFF